MMNPRRAQIIWSSIVAVTVAILAVYSAFKTAPASAFLRGSNSPYSFTHNLKDHFTVR